MKSLEKDVEKILKYIVRMKLTYRDAILCLTICIDALQQAGKEKENDK